MNSWIYYGGIGQAKTAREMQSTVKCIALLWIEMSVKNVGSILSVELDGRLD